MLKSISVCVCTFRRPGLLGRLLQELGRQETNGRFKYSIVVADNDVKQSAKGTVQEFAKISPLSIVYCTEPNQNIALARNRALASAEGEFIAFIDDDEYPDRKWLGNLLETCESTGVDGVLGPVIPVFESPPPEWVVKGGFFERPIHPTGYRISPQEARTGNLLFRRELLRSMETPFSPAFETGGEDIDFFLRATQNGSSFVWRKEAVVYEFVPASRCNRRYLLRRALLRGSNSFKQHRERGRSLVKSFIASPLYALFLPWCYLAGDHVFMKYLIKFCDHTGKLLSLFGIKPVQTRDP